MAIRPWKGRPGNRKGLKVASLYRGNIADADAVRSLDPLPETVGELRAMAKTLGATGDTIWLRDKASETRAKKEEDLSTYRVLAFATRGLMAGQFREYGEPTLVIGPDPVFWSGAIANFRAHFSREEDVRCRGPRSS